MLKARGALLVNVHSTRGALLQQQASSRALSPCPSSLSSECSSHPSSSPVYTSSKGFRGLFSIRGKDKKTFACASFCCFSQNGLNILALWSFESRSPRCSDAFRLESPKCLHTSSRGKLTTSELIKRAQLAKSTGSESASSAKGLGAGDLSLEKHAEDLFVLKDKGHVSEGETSLQDELSVSEKSIGEHMLDRGTVKMSLAKTIPQHVVDRGVLKTEEFLKNQGLQNNPRQQVGKLLQKSRQIGPGKRQNLPILQLSNGSIDIADELSRAQGTRNEGKQQKDTGWWNASQSPQLSSPGRKIAAVGSVKPDGLLAAGFEMVSFNRKEDRAKPGRLARLLDSTKVPSTRLSKERGDLIGSRESAVLLRDRRASSASNRSIEGQFQQRTERERVLDGQHFLRWKPTEEVRAGRPQEITVFPGRDKPLESHELVGESAAERQLAQHGDCTPMAVKRLNQDASQLGKESQECSENDSFASQSEVQFQKLKDHENLDSGSGQHFFRESIVQKISESPQKCMGLPCVKSNLVQVKRQKESVDLDGESTLNAMRFSTSETAGTQASLDNARQCTLEVYKEGEQIFDGGLTREEKKFAWHQESIKSAGQKVEIDDKQSFYRRPTEGVETGSRQQFDQIHTTGTRIEVPRENRDFKELSDNTQTEEGELFDRIQATDKQLQTHRDSDISFSVENTLAVPRKPFVRNRPRRKCKNELKEKDLSLQPIVGEPHYEYILRRKRVRAEAQKALKDDVDDYEHVGDDWVRKRLGWLCKEIPVLKASGLVKMLNNQRKWIKQEHVVELIEHLVRYMELNRAHRALKWMQQQPGYKFEYEIHNNMAYILGRNDKLSRCQDVFDEIVRNGRFPDSSVFTALIKAYLSKGDQGDINDAWKLYNQMLQLDLKVSPSLYDSLLKSLSCPSGHWIRQAEELLVKMRSSGLYINEEMYTRVLNIYGKRGDHKKVNALIAEMKSEHLEIDINVLNASLAACVKDGDTTRAEAIFRQVLEFGLKPNWNTYAHLIQIYGKAKSPSQAWEIFEKMKSENVPVNFVTYHAIIDAIATDGLHVEQVMQVLTDVEESGIKPLQPCYNSVMNMFLKLKRYEDVESIFKRGKAAKVRPGHAAYNMLLKSYTEGGQLEKAEAVFQEMKATEGMGPNTHTYNILLEGYGVGCFKPRVRELFEEMSAKGCQLDPDVEAKIKSMIGVKKIVELEKKKLKLTDEQREIIPGLLLGGAKMVSPDRNRTYELHLEFNSENQTTKAVKDHISFLFQAWWKQNEPGASINSEGALVEASGGKSLVRLETVSHGSLRFYAHQYRPEGEPVIPRLIHRWLKPRTMAYWYMYGGKKCTKTGGIILNASKYPGKQIQLVVKALKARTMDCQRKKKRNGDAIRFEGKSALWLWKLMEPYILRAVREQLKPEEIPVNLDFAEDNESWESHDDAISDEDDWDDLEAEKDELMACT